MKNIKKKKKKNNFKINTKHVSYQDKHVKFRGGNSVVFFAKHDKKNENTNTT